MAHMERLLQIGLSWQSSAVVYIVGLFVKRQ